MKLPRALAAASLTLSGLAVVAGPAPLACAGEGPDATLVIDTGSSEAMYCVALDAPSVSGLRLIELASQQHGISYSLGYQGQAVCMLAGVGSQEEECFQGGEPFWGYWRMGSSGWVWSGTGAGGARVDDGDVEGWAWGTGNDGASHQQPPTTTHEAVCGSENPPPPEKQPPKEKPKNDGVDKQRPEPGDDKNQRGGGGSPESSTKDRIPGRGDGSGDAQSSENPNSKAEAKDEREKSQRNKKRDPKKKRGDEKDGGEDKADVVVSTPTPMLTPAVTPSSEPAATSSGGPPAAGIAGLIGTIVLALVGAWFLKRRHAPVS